MGCSSSLSREGWRDRSSEAVKVRGGSTDDSPRGSADFFIGTTWLSKDDDDDSSGDIEREGGSVERLLDGAAADVAAEAPAAGLLICPRGDG